ncbi:MULTISPECIES: DUF423 domain-containing protein [unclassified Aureimonas]|uniref:DUF423 domain-containing protein n=1 Tax=unclassified Aureimonas TaxID=2615206 RepID=UPI0006F95D70|nr:MULTISPECIES: DUF423 domain-containing protein [unclassified Aureimonas]KQT66242.1 hypothetical protein ASG62_19640 [Aureimonas sp. Leaf427]KQT72431.1 hypothetical protein ASG54_04010 [Aureimonas sp. Leaf460]
MTRTAILLTVLSGLLGAAGAAGAAAAAHGSAGADLMMLAAAMALVHAPALLALAALPLASPLWKALPGLVLALGTLLFSGDLAMRALTGDRLFPMAAPAGGTLLIAGWLLLAVAALVSARRRN